MKTIHCLNPSCRKVWDYKGKNRVRAPCPDCGRFVRIKPIAQEIRREVEGRR